MSTAGKNKIASVLATTAAVCTLSVGGAATADALARPERGTAQTYITDLSVPGYGVVMQISSVWSYGYLGADEYQWSTTSTTTADAHLQVRADGKIIDNVASGRQHASRTVNIRACVRGVCGGWA
ncbi:hypothetical protein [Amycolatopsis benzoatilytica]|uniref:hypothetical protein n=1 Tax=Amycolatopsis benzoatilytica TaxID=346045 RepID=UPI001FE1C263|nr:hypothetical protein [Amycolatopsis benzoatilytica]